MLCVRAFAFRKQKRVVCQFFRLGIGKIQNKNMDALYNFETNALIF